MKNALGRFGVAFAAFAAAIGATSRSEAGFLFDTVHSAYLFPNKNTTFTDGGTQVVNPTASFSLLGSAIENLVTVSDTQITLGFGGAVNKTISAFNGIEVDTVGPAATIIGVTIDPATNLPGFNASDVSFTGTEVFLNVEGLSVTTTSHVVVDVAFAVPEPSSLALCGSAGLVGLAVASVRRKWA